MSGKLVGINTAIFSKSGGNVGIGFAIPSSMAPGGSQFGQEWVDEGGAALARRAAPAGRRRDRLRALGLTRPSGVLVTSVYDNGPAAMAGLKRGDAILAVDGQAVDNPDAFGYRFTLKGTKGQSSLTILRDGKQTETPGGPCCPPPEHPARDPVRVRSRSPLAGATLVNMSPAVAEELQIDISDDGVVVADLDEQGVAASVGFQKGDQIVAINGERLASTKDAERLTQRGSYWELTINRGGRVFTTVFGR